MKSLINMAENNHKGLRVAFIAGTLGQGGAEKQLVYMVRALLQAGVTVRVYSLTRGEYYESTLQALGIQPQWIGKYSSPVVRLIILMISLRNFKPHVLQSAHFFANLYVGLIAPIFSAVGIGSIRSDIIYEMESNPFWGKLLLTKVNSLIVNSQVAMRNATKFGVAPEKVNYLPNVIDLADFDRRHNQIESIPVHQGIESKTVVVSIGGLFPAKRFDRFIAALTIACRKTPKLLGIIIGDGPELANLQAFAQQKGLSEENFLFLGRRDDVPAILRKAQIFVLTSDHEGFPNVLLEAMAARLPVITTPAGDSSNVVQDGQTGYVVPFDDIDGLVKYMLRLAQSAQLRHKLGQAGRARVEQIYGTDGLAKNLLSIYGQIAIQRHSRRLIKVLSS
ncbi:glycosyltransferase [Chloroflexota bacterium]